MSFVYQCRCV